VKWRLVNLEYVASIINDLCPTLEVKEGKMAEFEPRMA
jgi:hypothetical protein